MKPYVLVSADFLTTGGMDRANYAVASYLAGRGHAVHLVGHRVAAELQALPNIRWHPVRKLGGSYLASTPLLDRVGRKWVARVLQEGGHAIVNGGNCLARGAVNWVHYVHAAADTPSGGGLLWRLKNQVGHRVYRAMERAAFPRARLILTNSERTRQDVLSHYAVAGERVRTLYLGTDPEQFRPATLEEKIAARERLDWSRDVPYVAFVGGLGDRRKGFDTLFDAWRHLCGEASWDAQLAVIGTGTELAYWQSRAAEARLTGRIHFLGFRGDVPEVLRACDALAAPTRYEAYGLGVHEALCAGLPALVSASAGVAERYGPALSGLLLPNPDDAADLAARLRHWRQRSSEYRAHTLTLAADLRARSWEVMAAEMVELIEGFVS